MSTIKHTATPDQLLEEVDHCFLTISGLPVINEQLQCIGVLSKKDRAKASKGVTSFLFLFSLSQM
jgi:CBS domain-containing protein